MLYVYVKAWAQRVAPWLPWLLSLSLLCWLAATVKLDMALRHIAQTNPIWLLWGVMATVAQHMAAAARWTFTARRMGLPMVFGQALREYYLSSLLNQVLPTGVAGEGVRTLRFGRALRASPGGGYEPADFGPALRSVVLERTAGQLTLASCALCCAPLWLSSAARPIAVLLAGTSLVLLVFCLGWLAARWAVQRYAAARRILADARSCLWARGAWLGQVSYSTAVLLGGLLHLYCAARCVGSTLPLEALLRVAPPVLASMALPVSFAGWGVREAVTAHLYGVLGLSTEQGTAVGVLYGLIALAGSIPGVLLLARTGAPRGCTPSP